MHFIKRQQMKNKKIKIRGSYEVRNGRKQELYSSIKLILRILFLLTKPKEYFW